MALTILGVHLGHDASACVLQDGRVVLAIQEERLSRIKNHEGFPARSIAYLLQQANLSPDQVDGIAVAGAEQHLEAPTFFYLEEAGQLTPTELRLHKALSAAAGLTRLQPLSARVFNREAYWRFVYGQLERLGLRANRVNVFDHHSCHAASAYFSSPFDRALVLTQDGRGDGLSGSVSVGEGPTLVRRATQSLDDSLGQLYAEVTRFLGYRPLRHEGKITGLAAFGTATPLAAALRAMFETNATGTLRRNWSEQARMLHHRDGDGLGFRERLVFWAQPRESHRHRAFSNFVSRWLGVHASGLAPKDVAYAIQWASEEIMVDLVRAMLDAEPDSRVNLCLAGGLFANVRINQRIRECHPKVNAVYIQPAMGDAGLSIGAALLEYGQRTRHATRPAPLPHVYLARPYDDSQIGQALAGWPGIEVARPADIEKEAAALIAAGKLVGRFAGATEFGPRALGNRSILIRPNDRSINDSVNRRLRRTEFMPFAPSVLDHRAADYFEGYRDDIATSFMTTTYNVRPERREEIQAVVHVDGTARPQVVKAQDNPSFHKLLSEYERITGSGCVVNTSFNMHEEPILESPTDALRALSAGAVDLLAIGSFLVSLRQPG